MHLNSSRGGQAQHPLCSISQKSPQVVYILHYVANIDLENMKKCKYIVQSLVQVLFIKH